MGARRILIAFYTIIRKDVVRALRVPAQVFLPPLVTTTLYFTIFGTLIGTRIGEMGGYTYMQFILPGLVMLQVITSAYMASLFSYFMQKFDRSIEEIYVSPTSPMVMVSGIVAGGVLRAIVIGLLVMGVGLFFTDIEVTNWLMMILFIVLSATLFATAGLINGIFAKGFESSSIIPTFVLTPLTYLGGVFYSVSLLPGIWQTISQWNPILYMVNGFRYGFLGISDVSISKSLILVLLLNVIFISVTVYLIRKGYGLKN